MKMCTKNFDFLSILFMQMCIEINLDILFTMLMTVRQEIIWKILILLKQKLMHSSKTKSTLYNLDRVTYKSCSMPFIQSKKSTQSAWTDWKSCNIKIPLQITLQGKATRQSLALVFVETPHYEIQKKKKGTAGPLNHPTQYGLEGVFEPLYVQFPIFHCSLISL